MSITFATRADEEGRPFPHYWEECVGSCHAITALRADWQRHMERARKDLGFKSVRFHGLFDDDMSVLVDDPSMKGGRLCFLNIDRIYDFLLDLGMKPFVELGFMPTPLASGTQTCFHYRANVTPPKDYAAWEDFLSSFIKHLVARYGVEEVRSWRFEVWNEPNLSFFWGGTQEEYFKLYAASARSLKAVDGDIQVGGPATAINAWIPDFLAYCRSHSIPVDFISTHHYPTDDPLWRGDITFEQLVTLGATKDGVKYRRGTLTEMVKVAKDQAGDLPLLYTEWNSSAMLPDTIHDDPYTAALAVKTIADNDGLVDTYSFWCVSDIFEESGQRAAPFHGGFGLQNGYGVPKPVYRAFEFLRGAGAIRLPIASSDPDSTVEALATRRDDGTIRVIVYNHATRGERIADEAIELRISGAGLSPRAHVRRVDEENANPKGRWLSLGSPEYPNKAEREEILAASVPMSRILEGERHDSEHVFRFSIPPHGVISLDILRS